MTGARREAWWREAGERDRQRERDRDGVTCCSVCSDRGRDCAWEEVVSEQSDFKECFQGVQSTRRVL